MQSSAEKNINFTSAFCRRNMNIEARSLNVSAVHNLLVSNDKNCYLFKLRRHIKDESNSHAL